MKTAQEAQMELNSNLENSFTQEQLDLRSKNDISDKKICKKLNEEKQSLVQELDGINYSYSSLIDMSSHLNDPQNLFKNLVNKIALRTYIGNGNYYHDNAETVVKRFALIAEELPQLIDCGLTSSVMHPLEKILFQSAFLELKQIDSGIGGVVIDVFVRTENQKIAKYENANYPETHSVLLWKDKEKFFLLDPSNSTFSSSLADEIQHIIGVNIQTRDGNLYGAGEKTIGREEAHARGCIDIAVKVILELTYQTNVFPNKDIKTKIRDTFCQLSTEPNYAKHFVTQSKNRHLREFTSSSSDIRHIALKVANSVIR